MPSINDQVEFTSVRHEFWMKELQVELSDVQKGPDIRAAKYFNDYNTYASDELFSITMQSLRAVCLKYEVEAVAVIEVCWKIVLGNYHGIEDVLCFGVQEHKLKSAAKAAWVHRGYVSHNIELFKLLLETYETDLGCREHRFTSLEEVVELFGRDIFSTTVCVHHGGGDTSGYKHVDGVTVTTHVVLPAKDEQLVSLRVICQGGNGRDAFDAANLAHGLQQALVCLSGDGGQNRGQEGEDGIISASKLVQDVEILSARDYGQIMEWNNQGRVDVVARQEIVPYLIRDQAARQPDHLAVVASDGKFTYRELELHVARLAARLVCLQTTSSESKFDPQAQFYVPFCFEKSKWTIVAILAILRARQICVPLDPSHPRARWTAILRDTKATILLASATQHAVFVEAAPGLQNIVAVDHTTFEGLPSQEELSSMGSVSSPVAPEDLAYCIYTSGTTGDPKGVIWNHQTLATSLLQHGREFHFNGQSRVLQFAAHVFDVSVAEMLTTLVHGGRICIPSESDRVDRDALTAMVDREKVNWAFFTPSFARLLFPIKLPTLKTVVMGGEFVSQNVIEEWAPTLDQLIVTYGPAETCIFAAKGEITSTVKPAFENVGNAMGCLMWLTKPSDTNKLAPIGAVGEILIEGPILSCGYGNDKIKTAKSFILNPEWSQRMQSTEKARRFYRTGDLAKYNPDGTICFLGRMDDQVKLRGQRFHLLHVASAIRRQNLGSWDVYVDVINYSPAQSARSNQSLVAFFSMGCDTKGDHKPRLTRVQKRTFTAAIRELKVELRKTLPIYMIPSIFIPVPQFPYLVSGKTDRKRLLEIATKLSPQELSSYMRDDTQADGDNVPTMDLEDRAYNAPSTEKESVLQWIFARVLGSKHTEVSLIDDFFAMGGTSITAIQVVSLARARGLLVTMVDIFENTSVKDLAQVAREAGPVDFAQGQAASELPLSKPVRFALLEPPLRSLIDKENTEDAYPTTPLQEGLLALSMKRSGAYTAQYVLQLPEHVDLMQFRKAWEIVAGHHPILRTQMLQTDSCMVQVVRYDGIEWQHSDNLAEYLVQDRVIPMQVESRLARYALVGRAFVWTVHHSLYDGWSIRIIFQDVERAYAGLKLAPTVSFSNFIQYLLRRDTAASAKYWRAQLAGIQTGISFPHLSSLIASIASDSFELKQVHMTRISRSVWTMSTRLRLAWALVLGRHQDSEDVVFGVTVSGRNAAVVGIEDIVGPLIATVPLRIKWISSEALSTVLDRIQSQATEMIPFEQTGLQNIAKLGITEKEACQFQTRIVVQPEQEPQIDQQPSSVDYREPIGIKNATTDASNTYNNALTLEFSPQGARMVIKAIYDSNVLDRNQIQTLLAQLASVLQHIHVLEENSASIEEIPLACREDQLIQCKQNFQSPLEVHSTIPKQFQKRVVEHPNSLALDSWDGQFSYRQLDEMSDAVSKHLIDIGVRPQSYVPFCFDKSSWAVISILGIMKAAAICVPIEPSYSGTHIRNIFEEVGAQVLCCSTEYGKRFSDAKLSVIVVDKRLLDILLLHNSEEDPADPERVFLSPEDLAYIIPTSGSTGIPKMIMLEHGGLCKSAKGHGDIMKVQSGTRVFQFSAYIYDVSIGDIATTLTHGACLCIPSESDRLNNLAGAINLFRADRVWLTPTVAGLLSPDECPTLQMVSLGGEVLTDYCRSKWLGKVTLINRYGPAEVSNLGTAVVVRKDGPASKLGYANGLRLWVVEPSSHERLTPVGCIGEMMFEGPNVARGYLRSLDGTKASGFIKCPTWRSSLGTKLAARAQCHSLAESNVSGNRFYKTGDLARLNCDGTVTFIGRKDLTIKLRGQRIELPDIESAIRTCLPSLAEVITDVVRPIDSENEPVLVAFIYVPSEIGYELDEIEETNLLAPVGTLTKVLDSVRTSVPTNVPGFMMPTVWIPLVRVPKLVSGKTNRKALHTLASQMTVKTMNSMTVDQKATKRMPSNVMESSMQDLWANILQLPQASIGIDDNFFHLGGDSIKAIKLVAAAKSRGLNLNFSMIFQKRSLCELSSTTVSTNCNSVAGIAFKDVSNFDHSEFSQAAKQCRISTSSIEDMYPCTPLQEGLMAASLQQPTAYIARRVLRLAENTNITIFRKVWQTVVDSIPILRTRIVQPSLQVVVRKEEFEWNEGDTLDLHSYLALDTKQPMTYGGLLSRQVILEHQRIFVWTVHHALYDGWSVRLLMDHLAKLYWIHSGFEENIPKSVYDTRPFKNFIQHFAQKDESDSDKFWLTQFSGNTASVYPVLPSTTYSPVTNTIMEHKFVFSRAKTASDTTTSSILRAAWSLIVASYSGSSEDVVFGATLNGRNVALHGIMDIVGPTLTTVPVRVEIDQTKTINAFLAQIQEQYVRMIPFEHTGLQRIKRVSAEASSACEFQTILSIQPKEGHNMPYCPGKQIIWEDETSHTPGFHTIAVVLQCGISENSIDIIVEYDSVVINTSQMERILYSFAHIATQLSHEGTRRLDEISALSSLDLKTILEWNKNLPDRINDCVHRQFEKRAKLNADCEAVSAWDGDFTYGELDEKSRALAVHLRSLGVSPETFVPFCFEKTKWTIVAILGILRAGGACVPLDPTQPVQRLQTIVKELGCQIITSSFQQTALLRKLETVHHVVTVDQNQRYCDASTRLLEIEPTDRGLKSTNACYVIYTSGSTGKAKGVVWDHATLCTSINEHGNAFDFGPSSRVLQFASYVFDVSVSEMLTTLVFGGCICIPSDAERLGDIVKVVNKMRVNWTFFTPSYARLLDPKRIPGLKTLVLGGEAPGLDNIARWAGLPGLQLIVTYGPAECCIYCAKNAVSDPRSDVSIGRSIGGIMWIVDLNNPSRLAPIGAVGEIVVEGHIVARGYLHDEDKTAAAFMPLPYSWGADRKERTVMYKTGDIGRYNPDGTIVCYGRRDFQRKIHGQRIELAEVEFHVGSTTHAHQAMAMIPTEGFCKDRLLVVVSISDCKREPPSPSPLNVYEQKNANHHPPSIEVIGQDATASKIATYITDMQDQLSLSLPVYMIPSLWVLVKEIPLMPASGKLNRAVVQRWVNNISHEKYLRVVELSAGNLDGRATAMSDVERKLQGVWSHVLNIPLERIGPENSFRRLGGDSISAMQVMTQCRIQGLLITMQDILKYGTISQISPHIRSIASEAPEAVKTYDEEFEGPFGLSPFQKIFMEQVSDGNYSHFNQSFLFELRVAISTEKLQSALQSILKRHGMLRARFLYDKEATPKWHQFIVKDTSTLRLQRRMVADMDETALLATETQKSLNIHNGPIVAADLYEMEGSCTLLFLCIHHLVVDLVSWRIILQDLEELLTQNKMSSTERPFPFHAWCERLEMEANGNRHHQESRKLLTYDVPEADYEYWGVNRVDGNSYRDRIEERFTLDAEIKRKLFSDCNHLLDTEPLDLMLSAALYSFNEVFPERKGKVPIYNEGHGRDPCLPGLDVSSTVGWFTALCPIVISNKGQSLMETIREVKDVRRRIPGNGVPYFASAFASSSKAQAFPGFEIVFNYYGLYQQLARQTSALKAKPWPLSLQPSDSDPNIQRLSLFGISAGVKDDSLDITVAFSAKMHHQESIYRWIGEFQLALESIAGILCGHRMREYTLSDFPHLPTTYEGLENLIKDRLPTLDIQAEQIEDIYPVSHMMQGILLSQAKSSTLYHVKHVWEVLPNQTQDSETSLVVDIDRLVQAWQIVVDRHAILRSVFIDGVSVSSEGSALLYDQIVLKHVAAPVKIEDRRRSSELYLNETDQTKLPLQYAIFVTIYDLSIIHMELAINHAITDGASQRILMDDFITAYDVGSLEALPSDCYGEYIRHMQQIPGDISMQYWKEYLQGCQMCLFPTLNKSGTPQNPPKCTTTSAQKPREHTIEFQASSDLYEICASRDITPTTVFQAAWALVLGSYVGKNDPCFGYLSSGRGSMPIKNIEAAVGPFINMLIQRVSLENKGMPLLDLLYKIQNDHITSRAHQTTSLAEIYKTVGLSQSSLFNTIVSVQAISPTQSRQSRIYLRSISSEDPTEYDIVLNIGTCRKSTEVTFVYQPGLLSDTQMLGIGKTFIGVLTNIMASIDGTLGDVDLLTDFDNRLINKWNRTSTASLDCRLDSLIHQRALSSGNATAIAAWDGSMTYKELDEATAVFGRYLIKTFRVGAESLVPICFEKSIWVIVAMLGILKSGAAFVPLNPSDPVQRLRELLSQIKATFVIGDRQARIKIQNLATTNCEFTLLDSRFLQKEIHHQGRVTSGEDKKLRSSDLAYVLFTSGSTGFPKGVMVEHGAISTSTSIHGKLFGMDATTRCLQFSSYTFDVCLSEIFATLVHGGCVCIPSEAVRANVDDLQIFIGNLGVNWAFLTPTFVRLLEPAKIPSLQTLCLTGEAYGPDNLTTWLGKVRLLNCYGPTECSVFATGCELASIEDDTIGRALGCTSWIVDPLNFDRLVPAGAVGELLLDGPIQARGYLDDTQKTNAAFVVPSWSRDGRRLYKTGDLVRYHEDGSLKYIGRNDGMQKFHGQRIEVGEIEHQVLKIEDVDHCVVVLPQNGPCRGHLVLIFTLCGAELIQKSDGEADVQISMIRDQEFTAKIIPIRDGLMEILPAYMIPSIWLPLHSIPMLSSGKLDRRLVEDWVTGLSSQNYQTALELLAPIEAAMYERDAETKATAQEKLLRSIWSRVINVPENRISVQSSSFMKIGGDSISAMQVVSACRSLKLDISIQDLLKGRTIVQIASGIDQYSNHSASRLPLEEKTKDFISSSNSEDQRNPIMYDLGPVQSLFMRSSPGENLFNQTFLVEIALSGIGRRIGKAELNSALDTLVSKHGMLRARFRCVLGRWKQSIQASTRGSYRLRCWGTVENENLVEMAQKVEESTRYLKLEDGPVFAAEFFISKQRQLLFLVAHHMVIDLVSWRIILQDLEDHLLNGEMEEIESTSFPQWCTALTTYKMKHLSVLPKEELLPFNIQPAEYGFWGMEDASNLMQDVITESFTLDGDSTSYVLKTLSSKLDVEPLDIIIAAVAHSFAKSFPERDVPPIYNEGHGRQPWDDSMNIFNTVGWFTIIYPILVHVDNYQDDIFQTIQQCKNVRSLIPSKGFSYFASLDIERETFATEVCFNYYGLFQQLDRGDSLFRQLSWKSVDITPINVNMKMPRHSLVDINVGGTHQALQFTFHYNRNMRHQDRIKKWIIACRLSLERMESQYARKMANLHHLPHNYDMEVLQSTVLPNLAILDSDVEDIYPCSPIQQGMLLTQSSDPSMYWFRSVYEVSGNGQMKRTLKISRLRRAWRSVIGRHAILRTVFIEQTASDGLFDQLVLRNYVGEITEVELQQLPPDGGYLDTLKIDSIPADILNFRKPMHVLRLFYHKPSGRTFCSFAFSHAIIDGASITILLRDFGRAYENEPLDGTAAYKNYISYLQNHPKEESFESWKSFLTGMTPCILPRDGSSTGPRHLSHAIVPHNSTDSSPSSLYSKMQRLAKELGVSLFSILQVVWALTLREYIDPGLEECSFGVINSGRDQLVDEIQDIAGPLVNMLPSRVLLPEKETIARIILSVYSDFVDHIAHQACSLAEIQHAIGCGSLFNTGITLQRQQTGPDRNALDFLSLGGEDPTEFRIVVHAIEDRNSVTIKLSYWNDEISDRLAFDMAQSFAFNLSQILLDPNNLLESLSLARPEEISQIWSWNAILPPRLDIRIEDMIAQKVIEHPKKAAICSTNETLTYEVLDSLSTAFATRYLPNTIHEDAIAVCSEKSIYAVVAMLAIIKSGATLLLLDPSYPLERMKSIIASAKPRTILASTMQTQMCKTGLKIDTITLSSDKFTTSSNLAQKSEERIDTQHKPTSREAAYIIFTSGSTGIPKGCIIEHGAFCTAIQSHYRAIGLLPESRVLQYASYGFDASLQEIFGSLMIGATICVPDETERSNNLVSFMNELHVTWAVLTPTVASLLSPENSPELSCLALCGEPMSVSDVAKWASRIRLVNAFGPSECCVASAANPSLNLESSPTCIGWPVGAVYWVVHPEDHDRLMRRGCIGELLIEGPILARLYLNNEDKTNEAFICNPRWARPGRCKRLYKTGDLVYQNPDGSFQYVGRKDKQAKIRGQRLELGEVENALKQLLPDLSTVAAEIVHYADRAPQLVAFFACNELVIPIGTSSIQSRLAQRLPAYMIPSKVISLQTIPTTASGKIDRRKLQDLAFSQSSKGPGKLSELVQRNGRLPESEMEKALSSLWKEVIYTSKQLAHSENHIFAEDSFFNIGGDSFSAMKLVTAARSKHIQLTVSNIMRFPTLETMSLKAVFTTASHRHQAITNESVSPFSLINYNLSSVYELSRLCHIGVEMVEDVYPCTPLQAGLFALSQKQPGSYIARFCYQLPQMLDVRRYKSAWAATYTNTQILRTQIVQLLDQDALDEVNLKLWQVVIKKELDWEQASSLEAYLGSNTIRSTNDQLSRFAIIIEPDGSRFFVLTIHHAAYDAWSLPRIFKNVTNIYNTGNSLPSRPFREFIKHLGKMDNSLSKSFWTTYLEDAAPSSYPVIPRDYVVSATNSFECFVEIPEHDRKSLTTATRIRGAWAIVLNRYMEKGNAVFGETLSGRNESLEGIADIDGPLITTVPVYLEITESGTLSDALENLQTRMVDMIPFQQIGLQNITKMSRKLKIVCSFSSLISINSGNEDTESLGLGLKSVKEDAVTSEDYPISIQFSILPHSRLGVKVIHDECLVDTVQMKRIVNQFTHVLHQICEGSVATFKDVELISASDRAEIQLWNDASPPKTLNQCLHWMIEAKVGLQPENQAVCAWDGDLSYEELNQTSSRLAEWLSHKLGAIAGNFIPISMEKSLWAVVTMLAIMKSGAAFVPIDESHPPERLRSILERLGAKVVLASRNAAETLSCLAEVHVIDKWLFEKLDNPDHDVSVFDHFCGTPDDVLYAIFTSGTTGIPKGAVMTHRAFSSGAGKLKDTYGMGLSTRTLQFASYTFDTSIEEIFTTLLAGGIVCIPSEEERKNDLVGCINRYNINFAQLTPSVADIIGDPSSVPTLKTLILGGEPMKSSHITTWLGRVTLMNSYGPSECCVTTTVKQVMGLSDDPLNIGTSVGGICWISEPSDHTRLAPIGTIGELLIGGPIVGRGYLGEEAKTKAAFVADAKGQPLYRTGDLCKYNTDGTIQFIGRRDAQVKLHGQRLELTEIEGHFTQLGLGNVAVDVISIDGRSVLAAFVPIQGSLMTGKIPPAREVSSQLSKLLPRYMIPTVFVPIDNLPLNTSGKLDRGVLRQKLANLSAQEAFGMESQRTAYRPPSNKMEVALQKLFARVLRLDCEDIGVDDHFFDLGGDSISAMKLVAAAAQWDIALSVSGIFHHPKLGDLSNIATTMSSGDANVAGSARVQRPFAALGHLQMPRYEALDAICRQLSIFEGDLEDIYPTTDYQAWALSHGTMRSRGNTNYFTFNLYGTLDTFRIEEACRQMVARNPILRTVFTIYNHHLLQVILRSYQIEFSWYGKQHIFDENSMRSVVLEDSRRSVDISQPIVRFKLLLHSYGHHILTMRISHAQYDGLSLPSLYDDLISFYNGQNPSPKPLFSEFIHAIKAREAQSMAFWQDLMAGSSMTEVVHHAGPAYNHTTDANRSKTIPLLTPNKSGSTIANLVKSAWSAVLATISGQNDIVFGQLVSGRNLPLPGISETCGPCINLIPVRVQFDKLDTVNDLVQMLHRQALDAMPFENFGFRRLIQGCTDWPRWVRFSSVIQHDNIDDGDRKFAFNDELQCQIGIIGPAYDSSDLWIQSTPKPDGLLIEIGFCSKIIPGDFVDIILEKLCSTLLIISQDPTNLSLSSLIAATETPLIPLHRGVNQNKSVEPLVDEIWATILPKSPSVPLDQPYFEIWGDDIAAIQFVGAYASRGINLDIEDIFEHPTKRLQCVLCTRILAAVEDRAKISASVSFRSYTNTPIGSSASVTHSDVSTPITSTSLRGNCDASVRASLIES